MTGTQSETDRQQARYAELARMFLAAETLEHRCGSLVEMVAGRAASNLLLAQLGVVVTSAIEAIRLRIVDENSPDNWPGEETQQDVDASVSRCSLLSDWNECARHRAGVPCGDCEYIVQDAGARTADATDGEAESPAGGADANSAAVCSLNDRTALLTPIVLHLTQVNTLSPAVLAMRLGCSVGELLDVVRTSDSLCLTDLGEVGFASEDRSCVTPRRIAEVVENGDPVRAVATLPTLVGSARESMVTVIDQYFSRYPEATVQTLAHVARVHVVYIRSYLAESDKLTLDERDVVRRLRPPGGTA